MKFKKSIAAIVSAGVLTLSGCSLFGSGTGVTNGIADYDYSQMKFVQFDEPYEGQPLAVIETTKGTFEAVLYPEYAPNTVDNFVNRANEGFYNDKDIYGLFDQALFLTGACNEEGTQGYTNDGKLIPNEYSVNLWTFKGALCSFNGNAGYGDSRFFAVNNKALTDEELEELRSFKDSDGNRYVPDEVIDKYIEKGGVIHIAGSYTVFGQAISGLDVIEDIATSAVDEETARPIEEIKVKSITIGEYHAAERGISE